jgi:heparan-alpha-glucosaminide N-acetyltransferase
LIATLPTRRIRAIDAFRGLTILVMVFVNQLAGVSGVPQWARHMKADADAMSFVDVVFPAFLFIVGMSIPFALAQRQARGDDGAALQRHVLGRTLGLLVLGLFMVNAEDGFNPAFMPWSIGTWSLAFYACVFVVWGVYGGAAPGGRNGWRTLGVLGLLVLADAYKGGADGQAWMTHQWWGILGLIGWSYLIAATAWLCAGGRVAWLLAAATACVAYYAASQAVAPAAHPGWAAILAEPALVCETSLTLLGAVTSVLFFGPATTRRVARVVALVTVLVVAGALLRPLYTISKIYGSPTWCLYSAAICIVLFAALHWLVDVRGHVRWTAILMPVAAQPLVAYLIPFVVEAALGALHVELPDVLNQGAAGVAFCGVFVVFVLGATALVARRIRLQL